MSNMPIIASFWHGNYLGYLEQLCLKSFVDHGHRVILYSYSEIPNCPAGVELMDAERILPLADSICHDEPCWPGFHSDAFRYKLLSLQSVIWVSTDMFCLRPWDFKDQWIFGWEKTDAVVCSAALSLPRFSRTLARLNDFCEDVYPIPPWIGDEEKATLEATHKAGQPKHITELEHDVRGAETVTYLLQETGEISYVKPRETFFPISFRDRLQLLSPENPVEARLTSESYGIHLWGRRLKRGLLKSENGKPAESSFLGLALARHEIDPNAFPIPESANAVTAKSFYKTAKGKAVRDGNKLPQTEKPKVAPKSDVGAAPVVEVRKHQSFDLPNMDAQPITRAPIDPSLPTVASLWIGGTLSFLEQVCLLSFRDYGHRTVLYTYHGVDRVPDGVEIRDANEVLPAQSYVTHKATNSPAPHADIFRLHMIQQTGFIWVDADMLCMRPWKLDEGFVLGWETQGEQVCNAVLGLPKNSATLQEMLTFCSQEYPIPPWTTGDERAELEKAAAAGTPVHATDMKWGLWGPSAITHFLGETGEIENAFGQEAFFPVPFKERRQLLRAGKDLSNRIGNECLGVHLWNRRIRRRIVTGDFDLPEPESFVGKALLRHRVDPRLAPIPDQPMPGYDTQADILAKMPENVLETHREDYLRKAAVYSEISDCTNASVVGQLAHVKGSIADLAASRNKNASIVSTLNPAKMKGSESMATPKTPDRKFDLISPVASASANAKKLSFSNQTGVSIAEDFPPDTGAVVERCPIDPSLPTVAGLWIGGTLSFLEQVCLLSFRDYGHRTILYTYHGVDRVPEGIEVLDANKVMPADSYITHKNSDSPALHSDVFRYHMILQTGFVWIDADVLCVRPWRMPKPYLFGWEKPPKLICGAVLGIPQDSPGLKALLDFCEDEYPIPPWAGAEERAELEAAHAAGKPIHVTELKWGVWGPAALTHFLIESGEVEETLCQEAFYPVLFKDRTELLEPGINLTDKIGRSCLGVHLWNRRIRRRIITHEAGLPHPEGLLGKALLRHRVDPRLAPIPDTPPPGSPLQSEVLADAPKRRIEKLGDKFFSRAEIYDTIKDPVNANVAGDIIHPKGSLIDLIGATEVKPKPAAATAKDEVPTTTPTPRLPIDMLRQSAPYQKAIDNLELRTDTISDRLPPLSGPMDNDEILFLTSMKNEAPFILEWIAYHKAIGAKHFLVYTNDCRDNTNEILDRLSDLGLVTRLDNPWDPASGRKPQHVALEDAMKQPCFKNADWVLTIDVDEFVNIHVGDGTFADLFKASNYPNVISFTWKFFGNDRVDLYEDRPMIEQFTACAPEFIPKPRLGWGFKSMLHKSAPYTKIGVHRPLKIDDEDNVENVRWVNGSGRKMPEMLLTNNGWRSTKRSLGYRLATLNHYILRSAESFLVKRDRGRINHTEQDQGIDYWLRRNYYSETDNRMHKRLPMLQVELDKLMADEQLASLHKEAVVWHENKIAELKADPNYAKLYSDLTEIARPDAIYLTKPEEEDKGAAKEEAGIQIPEPEMLTLSEEEAAAKQKLLQDMFDGKVLRKDVPKIERAPATAKLKTTALPSPRKRVLTAPATAKTEAPEPRFEEARAHAQANKGFFWEGPENALFFEPKGKRLVVTFDNIHIIQQNEPRWPWGYDFLTKTMGCSVLGVMGRKRNWFRSAFVHDSFDSLRDSGFFKQFDDVIFYGASMGAFGAITYSQCAPGARVMAIAPQSTLDRRILPDDNRWGWTKRLDWDDRYADASAATQLAKEIVVLSDPYFEPDRKQVERFSGSNFRYLKMPFFGHQLPNALVNMGIMKPFFEDFCDGALTNKRYYDLFRARNDLPRYQHDLLMRAEEKGHLKLAIQICEYTLKKRNAGNIRNTLNKLRAQIAEDV